MTVGHRLAFALGVSAALLLGFDVTSAAGQDERAREIEAAQAVRDTLTRPPADHGLSVGDVVSFPIDLLALPLELAIRLSAEAVALVAVPERYGPFTSAYASITDAGFRPMVTSDLGSASGPGLALAWVGLAPITFETAWSVRDDQRQSVEFMWERGAGTLDAAVSFGHRNEEPFWGIGPGTPRFAKSDYAQDAWIVSAAYSRQVIDGVTLHVGGGWEHTTVFRGDEEDTPDTRDVFGEVPGVLGPSQFLVLTAGVEWERMRRSGLRPTGVEAKLRIDDFSGAGTTSAAFHRVSLEAAAHLPVTSHQHLTLRGRGWSTGGGGDAVPFTHLPVLGGGASLRSYEWLRFRDRAAVVASAEWRWELWRDLRERARIEAMFFGDYGAVGPSVGEVAEARGSWGPGLTGRWGPDIEVTAYIAFGREGSRASASIDARLF